MPINESDIEKIAQLAHLEISGEELLVFAPQIADIVTYVEQLSEVDTSNIGPAIGGLTREGARPEDGRRRSSWRSKSSISRQVVKQGGAAPIPIQRPGPLGLIPT